MNIMVMYMYLLWIKISDIKKTHDDDAMSFTSQKFSISHFWHMPARNINLSSYYELHSCHRKNTLNRYASRNLKYFVVMVL